MQNSDKLAYLGMIQQRIGHYEVVSLAMKAAALLIIAGVVAAKVITIEHQGIVSLVCIISAIVLFIVWQLDAHANHVKAAYGTLYDVERVKDEPSLDMNPKAHMGKLIPHLWARPAAFLYLGLMAAVVFLSMAKA